eukprot:12377831-Heterocapsa_arctica.AAC.1
MSAIYSERTKMVKPRLRGPAHGFDKHQLLAFLMPRRAKTAVGVYNMQQMMPGDRLRRDSRVLFPATPRIYFSPCEFCDHE